MEGGFWGRLGIMLIMTGWAWSGLIINTVVACTTPEEMAQLGKERAAMSRREKIRFVLKGLGFSLLFAIVCLLFGPLPLLIKPFRSKFKERLPYACWHVNRLFGR